MLKVDYLRLRPYLRTCFVYKSWTYFCFGVSELIGIAPGSSIFFILTPNPLFSRVPLKILSWCTFHRWLLLFLKLNRTNIDKLGTHPCNCKHSRGICTPPTHSSEHSTFPILFPSHKWECWPAAKNQSRMWVC